ncbi:MAG TPA: 2-nitropropane dioxygenase [Gammaproteobacteria bacterium]|nr:2-nitropropane dioxygenase [Gammaproteobacteria bacterium]
MATEFSQQIGIETPLICGAMYPCSNPQLVAAVSEAGGIGIVQPLSLTYVHGYDFREGLRYIRSLTKKPIGMNLIIEQSSQKYLERMREYLDIALEEDVPFFVTALGDPSWVVEKTSIAKATVYHDVTERKYAQKALDGGVDGFICVNNRAGGHAGKLSPEQLIAEVAPLNKPMICAGGIGSAKDYAAAIKMGYSGAQLGTRFIASKECTAQESYKQAILDAKAADIVLTERISGVPVSIIETPYIKRIGTHAGPIAKMMLKGRKTKHWMRTIYSLMSIWKLKKSAVQGMNYKDYFQAGKSVEGISEIQSAAEIVKQFTKTN